MNFLCFLERKGRMLDDEVLKFIAVCFFEIESRGTGVKVANVGK